ncbi:MAG TPA: cobalamin-dependent protein [Polyangia bacterium]|nr:cobalamin-dependent protein [Polyangia bacterium]
METAHAPDLDDLRRRFLSAQLAGRRDEGLRVILDEGLRHGVGVADLHLRVIQSAQQEIGRLWQENRCSVAQEHVATAISQLALAHLYQHLPRAPRNGKRVLLACVEGELHELGARIASDFLEMAGFDVQFVGANTPVESLVALTKLARPDLLALSISLTFNMPALRQTIARTREEMGQDFPIAVGGPAIEFLSRAEAARELDVPVLGGDAAELAASVRAVLGLS